MVNAKSRLYTSQMLQNAKFDTPKIPQFERGNDSISFFMGRKPKP